MRLAGSQPFHFFLQAQLFALKAGQGFAIRLGSQILLKNALFKGGVTGKNAAPLPAGLADMAAKPPPKKSAGNSAGKKKRPTPKPRQKEEEEEEDEGEEF